MFRHGTLSNPSTTTAQWDPSAEFGRSEYVPTGRSNLNLHSPRSSSGADYDIPTHRRTRRAQPDGTLTARVTTKGPLATPHDQPTHTLRPLIPSKASHDGRTTWTTSRATHSSLTRLRILFRPAGRYSRGINCPCPHRNGSVRSPVMESSARRPAWSAAMPGPRAARPPLTALSSPSRTAGSPRGAAVR